MYYFFPPLCQGFSHQQRFQSGATASSTATVVRRQCWQAVIVKITHGDLWGDEGLSEAMSDTEGGEQWHLPGHFIFLGAHTHTHTMNFCWKNPIT